MTQAFAPQRIEQSLTALENAQPDDAPALDAARRAIAECERKLTRHRAALEAGADPALVVAWIHQVQQQRTVAEARLATLTSHHGTNRRMSRDDIRAMVNTLGGLLDALRTPIRQTKQRSTTSSASASPTTTQNTPYWPKPDQHHPCA